ncbi:hypothetical protein BB341_29585 (plasmid) [Streptomyces clavuligerus]|uniref:Uncharacterized protein n=2 Tax=Streptomyces clavuligerus TaxID=1901 RepID=D5SKZ1_STRCL|nr:hypothetical protein BB341_29585 [Streptomyces clavuligerus]EFG04584.1 Hypothetical protein SCLAV_p1098 [Streptomyces clavuligerus]
MHCGPRRGERFGQWAQQLRTRSPCPCPHRCLSRPVHEKEQWMSLRNSRLRPVPRMAAAVGAMVCAAFVGLPGSAQAAPAAAPAVAAGPVWYCGESGWHYPDADTEVRTLLCLGESVGQLTPSLTSECKYNGNFGWASTKCDAKDLRYRLTDPNGTVHNGSMPDGTGYYWDIYGTPDVPCVVGEWKFEQSSTHRKWGDSWSAPGPWGNTSTTRTVKVDACS